MKRDLHAELEILQRENSHLREQISALQASELNSMVIRRENRELRLRQNWLEQRIVDLELASLHTLAT